MAEHTKSVKLGEIIREFDLEILHKGPDYEDTPLYVVYEMVRALAERYGTYIVGSELVGLTPAKALLDCAEYYLKLENFDYRNQVMEYHVIDMKND